MAGSDGSLRAVLSGIIERLANSGRLDSGWTRDEATDWLWSRAHIDVWHQLVVERHWNPNNLVNRVTGSLWQELTRSAGAS